MTKSEILDDLNKVSFGLFYECSSLNSFIEKQAPTGTEDFFRHRQEIFTDKKNQVERFSYRLRSTGIEGASFSTHELEDVRDFLTEDTNKIRKNSPDFNGYKEILDFLNKVINHLRPATQA